VAVGDLDGDPGGDRGTLTRCQQPIFERVQVETRVARVRTRRQDRPLVEAADAQVHARGATPFN
jgi:hypothetical protein